MQQKIRKEEGREYQDLKSQHGVKKAKALYRKKMQAPKRQKQKAQRTKQIKSARKLRMKLERAVYMYRFARHKNVELRRR